MVPKMDRWSLGVLVHRLPGYFRDLVSPARMQHSNQKQTLQFSQGYTDLRGLHCAMNTTELQEVAKAEAKRFERQILAQVDRLHYDMRHPYWREELAQYMENCADIKSVVESS